MENNEYIENNNSQNEVKSNKNSEFNNKVSEANSSGQFTFKSNKKNVIDYETNKMGVLKIMDELERKYAIKKEDEEKKEEKKEERPKDNSKESNEKQKNEKDILEVYQLFCKDKKAKNLKEKLIYHYKIENKYINILEEYKELIDEKNNFFDDHIVEEKCVKLITNLHLSQ